MWNAHPSADLPADVPKPAFLTADKHAYHQEAEQNSDCAYETASHVIQNSPRGMLVRSGTKASARGLISKRLIVAPI